MSAVSSPLSPPASEPVVPRRRAPETEAAPFSLPEKPVAEAKVTPAPDRSASKGSEPGAPQQKQAAAAPAVAAGAQTTIAKQAASVVDEPVAPVPADAVPAASQPKSDIGALLAIAQAEEAAAGEVGQGAAKPKKPGEDDTPAADPGGEEAGLPVPVALPELTPATPPPPAVAPTLPAASDAAQPAATGGEASPVGSVEPGATNSAPQAVAGQGAAAQVADAAMLLAPVQAAVAEISGDAVVEPEQDPLFEPGHAKPVRMPGLPFDIATAGTPAASDAETDALAADAAGASHARVSAKETAVEAGAPAGSVTETAKPPEAAQPSPPAIDLPALAPMRAGKPEIQVPVSAADQLAQAQAQIAAGHHDAADGPPTPLHVVPVEIGLRALAGSKRFDIRLDPGELGRIDVNLEISDKGEVSARLVVDRVETLHLLQRDARTLERAFEQAGLKPSDAGVDITLRDPGDQSGFRQNRQDEQAPRHARTTPETDIDDVAIAAQPVPVRRLVRLGGVDLSI